MLTGFKTHVPFPTSALTAFMYRRGATTTVALCIEMGALPGEPFDICQKLGYIDGMREQTIGCFAAYAKHYTDLGGA